MTTVKVGAAVTPNPANGRTKEEVLAEIQLVKEADEDALYSKIKAKLQQEGKIQ